jgi:hypothetical protein
MQNGLHCFYSKKLLLLKGRYVARETLTGAEDLETTKADKRKRSFTHSLPCNLLLAPPMAELEAEQLAKNVLCSCSSNITEQSTEKWDWI